MRDVIRLKSARMSMREMARGVGSAPSTVRLTIRAFEAAGAELAVDRRRHRHGAGGPAFRQRGGLARHAAEPSPSRRSRTGRRRTASSIAST